MKISERTLRITAASVLALLMVGASYLLSGPNFLTSHFANAESTDDLLKAYASKDTDGDGLPDWEEALYGTDPNKAISNSFGIPDGQAAREGKLTPNALASQLPGEDQGTATLTDADFGGTPAPAPGSITDQFSKEFLQEYLEASNGQPMDEDTEQALVDKLMQQFSQQAAGSMQSSYSQVSIHTSNVTTSISYASEVEAALTENDPGITDQPLDLMGQLIQGNDLSAQKKLTTISVSYQKMALQLKNATVPPSLISTQLQLVKSLEELSRSTSIVSNYQKDPLATIGAFSVYKSASQNLSQGIDSLANVLLSQGEPQEGDPGFLIVNLARLHASS